eukprot:2605025-Pyramimonas_sp.AAC.1
MDKHWIRNPGSGSQWKANRGLAVDITAAIIKIRNPPGSEASWARSLTDAPTVIARSRKADKVNSVQALPENNRTQRKHIDS